MEKLGRTTVDGYRATVGFVYWSPDQEVSRVILTLRKPRRAPGIRAVRLQVWLLEIDEKSGAVPLVGGPHTAVLPEEGEGEVVTARGVYFFRPSGRRSLVGVVVTVDGRPAFFPLHQNHDGIAPQVIAAWKEAGATFFEGGRAGDETYLPRFAINSMDLPQDLPLPTVPFGLSRTGDREPGFLTRLPGRTRAQEL